MTIVLQPTQRQRDLHLARLLLAVSPEYRALLRARIDAARRARNRREVGRRHARV